jgi:hypothetical protein
VRFDDEKKNFRKDTAKIGCATGTPPVFLYVWQRKGLRVNFADVWQQKELEASEGLKASRMELSELTGKFGRGIGKAFGEMVDERRSCLSLLYGYGNYNWPEVQK